MGVGGATSIIHPQKNNLKKEFKKNRIKKKRASFVLQKVFSFIFFGSRLASPLELRA
jgi:hypothetical protein